MSARDPFRPPRAEVGNALLARIAREDQRAMEDFYSGYQCNVYRFACAQLGDTFAAAELLNEVMMQVWRGDVRRPAGADPLTWTLALTYRTAVKLAPKAAPVQASAATILRGLSAGLRAAIHLALVEDLPVAAIASILGRGEDDIRTSLREATAQLRSSHAAASS